MNKHSKVSAFYFERYKKIANIFLYSIILVISNSCKKYLDEKPLQTYMVPSSAKDMYALLDNENTINLTSPYLGEVIADNYYVTTARWQYLSTIPEERSGTLNYIWDKDITDLDSWRLPYRGPIYYSNIVLDYLPVIDADESDKNILRGSALFYRAFNFHELSQLYCKPYSVSAADEPGIVLKLSSNINERSTRATLQQTYDKIITDLKEAAQLLPEHTAFPTRPTRAAAFGALARVYLTMADYTNAARFADSCLTRKNTLMDYNTLVLSSDPVFMVFNPEVIFHNKTSGISIVSFGGAKIDSVLFSSYNDNDLRKGAFFKQYTAEPGTYGFKGSYIGNEPNTGSSAIFDGITTDETYLIRAECYARAGNKDAALADLNTLMITRWRNNSSWNPFTASSSADALSKILIERRKELVYRGLRWSDLRRFNVEGAGITLKRIIGGVTYTLPPNDPRWVLLIPQEVINRSGIAQNPR